MSKSNTNQELVSFNVQATDNKGVKSPVKFEQTDSSMVGGSKIGSSNASTTGIAAMMRDLDQIQSEQAMFTARIEKEKKRKDQLADALIEQREQLKYYQHITKNGRIVQDDEMISKKMVGKLEYQVAQSRNKLSSTRKENLALKIAITEARQEKLFHVSVLNDLKKELHQNKALLIERKDEINLVNNKKQRKEVDISNMKQKMFTDMDAFSDELQEAKRNVVDTQADILDGIRARLQSTFSLMESSSANKHSRRNRSQGEESNLPNNTFVVEKKNKLQKLLSEVKVNSLEELIVTLQKTEELMFQRYNDIQALTTETEKYEIDNKHLEQTLENELNNLCKLEASSDHLRLELEEKISIIHHNIKHYDTSFTANLETLNSVKVPLQGIFLSMSLDESPIDQALITTGVTDRNIPDYLGQIEQRIDELIQMMKASKHEKLNRDDFVRAISSGSGGDGHNSSNNGDVDDGATHGHRHGGGVTKIHNLPSLFDMDDEDEYGTGTDVPAPVGTGGTAVSSAGTGTGISIVNGGGLDKEGKANNNDRNLTIMPISVSKLKGLMAKKMSNGMFLANNAVDSTSHNQSSQIQGGQSTTNTAMNDTDINSNSVRNSPSNNRSRVHTPHTPTDVRSRDSNQNTHGGGFNEYKQLDSSGDDGVIGSSPHTHIPTSPISASICNSLDRGREDRSENDNDNQDIRNAEQVSSSSSS